MRWLIFILLFSCGKHESPKALDLRDSDGDQILNAYEADAEKYIANIERLGKVQGKIRFKTEALNEYAFSNLALDAQDLMVRKEKTLLSNDYLSEGRKIKIENSKKIGKLNLTNYTVLIEFDDLANEPEELLLVQKNRTISLGPWEKTMKFSLAVHELTALLNGEAHLSLVKNLKRLESMGVPSEQTIKEQTYRVYQFVKGKSEVLYVSKELPFKDLLDYLKINSHQDIVEDQFFFDKNAISNKTWWVRHFPNGDKVLAYTSIQELKSTFLSHYTKAKNEIKRENGKAKNKLTLTKDKEAVVYLRFRSTQVMRSFKERSSQTEHYLGGGGGREGSGGGSSYVCKYQNRAYSDLAPGSLDILEVLNNLIVRNGNQDISQEFIKSLLWEEGQDEKGIFWEIKTVLPYESLTFEFLNREAATFIKTGVIQTKCSDGPMPHERSGGIDTNLEGKLSLDIESYIEKIDERHYN